MAKKRRRISVTVNEDIERRLIQFRDECHLRSTSAVVSGMLNLFLWAYEARASLPPPHSTLSDEIAEMFGTLSQWEPTPEPGSTPVRHPNPNRHGPR